MLRYRIHPSAFTLHPFQVGPDGIEPSSGPYKEPALTVELQACGSWRSLGPEGFEPPPREFFHSVLSTLMVAFAIHGTESPIRDLNEKARCAAVTPRPRVWSRYPFQSLSFAHCVFSSK